MTVYTICKSLLPLNDTGFKSWGPESEGLVYTLGPPFINFWASAELFCGSVILRGTGDE